jgi:hypothetical protein
MFYITDVTQVIEKVRLDIAAHGRADVEFTAPGGRDLSAKIFEVADDDGTITLFGKEYAGCEFTYGLDEIENLRIFGETQ